MAGENKIPFVPPTTSSPLVPPVTIHSKVEHNKGFIYKLGQDGKHTPTGVSVKSAVEEEKKFEGDAGMDALSDKEIDSKKKTAPKMPSVGKEKGITEAFTLEGEVSLLITTNALIPKIGDTISLNGFGSYLSGSYYVTRRVLTLSTGGYTLVLSLLKRDFSSGLKKG